MADELGSFPVDEVTLQALEHAMGGALTFDRPEGAPDDGGPWLVGAEYSLSTLLDFLAGCMGDDPNGIVIDPGHDVDQGAPLWEQMRGARIVEDTRVHYSEYDVIKALIAEVRRLRELNDRKTQGWDYFFEETKKPCARQGCDKPAAIRVNDSLELCGQHYREHTGR